MREISEREELLSSMRTEGDNAWIPFNQFTEHFTPISTATIRAMLHPDRELIRADTCEGIFSSGWDDAMVRDYQQLWYRDGIATTDLITVTARLKSFQFYEHLIPQQEAEYPEERTRQAEAILKVLIHHQKMNGADEWTVPITHPGIQSYPFIIDARLRELLLASDYDRDMVLGFIVERKIFDGEELASLLESAHPTLTQGTL